MGYGLQVENADQDFIIDSTQPYSSFGILSSGSSSLTTATGAEVGTFNNNQWVDISPLNGTYYTQNFPSQITGTDLFFIKLPKDGFVGELTGANSFYSSAHKWVHQSSASSPSTTYAWKEINTMAHANMNITDWNSSYGLNVFKEYSGTAQQSDLIFSSQAEIGISIVAVGSYSDITSANQRFNTVNINSSDPHYFFVNGSTFNRCFTSWLFAGINGYYFTYSSATTLQKIDIYTTGIGNAGFVTTSGSTDTWMIIKVTGDT